MSTDQGGSLHPNVQTYVAPAQVQRDIAIDSLDLSASMLTQSGHVSYYGELLARAKHQMDFAKLRMEMVEAQTIKDLRGVYAARQEKAISETRLEKEVRLVPAFVDAQKQFIDARYVFGTIESVMLALDHRRSTLLQIAKGEAQERWGNPVVRAPFNA